MVKKKRTSLPYEVKMIPVSKLNFWEENPRRNEKASEKLIDIIKTHGFIDPCVVWKKNMVVYVGNTRLKAGIKLDMKKIPCIIKNWKTEKEAIAYGIANNKSDEWAGWDDDKLSDLLSKKNLLNSDQGIDMGFSEKELDFISKMGKNLSANTYSDIIDEFKNGKKSSNPHGFWMWFECPNEKTFKEIQSRFAKTKENGKRYGARELHFPDLYSSLKKSSLKNKK